MAKRRAPCAGPWEERLVRVKRRKERNRMKKKLLTIALLVLALILVLQSVSFAVIPPPPPPPPEPTDCSPGFWKNHTELWWGLVGDPDAVLADLKARGHGSGDIRHDAAAMLNDLGLPANCED